MKPSNPPNHSIDVIGLGYVGASLFVYLGSKLDCVRGIDIKSDKINQLRKQQMPFFEPGAQKLLDRVSNLEDRLFEKIPHEESSHQRFYVVCVGTPPNPDGSVNLDQIFSVAKEIADCISQEPNTRHTIVVRSTVPPGTCQRIIDEIFQNEQQCQIGENTELYFFPEFLREGQALGDIETPSLSVIGTRTGVVDDRDQIVFDHLVTQENNFVTDLQTSEMVKYANNSFHALKAAFANEFSGLAHAYDVNVDTLNQIFLSDEKLNISKAYLKPGFAFGGPCLTKDLKAVNLLALQASTQTPLLDSILNSNQQHLRRFLARLELFNAKTISFYGISFKQGTTDLRESQILKVIESLLDRRSYQDPPLIKIFDSSEAMANGQTLISHKNVSFVDSFESLTETTDLLVIGPKKLTSVEARVLKNFSQPVLDLRWPQDSSIIGAIKDYHRFP